MRNATQRGLSAWQASTRVRASGWRNHCTTVGKFGTPIGPDLSKVGAKHDLADLTKWLQDPASQKPRAHMPKIQLSETEVRALAVYLGSQR